MGNKRSIESGLSISDYAIIIKNRNARWTLFGIEFILLALLFLMFFSYAYLSLKYNEPSSLSITAGVLFLRCLKECFIFVSILWIISRLNINLISRPSQKLSAGFLFMFDSLLYYLFFFGFFFCLIYLIIFGPQFDAGIKGYLKYIYDVATNRIGATFLNQFGFEKEKYIHHFQNLFLFYIPLAIAWLSILLTTGFGPLFKGYIYHDLKTTINAKRRTTKKPIYIYILYLIKLVFIKYPFPFLFGLVLNFILLLFPFINLLLPKLFYERFYSFSNNIAYPSFIFITLNLFLTPFLYSYFNLEETFEAYCAYHSKSKILEKFNDHYLIIGYGNLGRSIIKHTLRNIFMEGRKFKKRYTKNLEIIIDTNMQPKVVVSNFAIININENSFTQTYTDATGLRYGFVEAGRDENLWLLGILGNACNPSILESINFRRAKLIINATDSVELPFKIFDMIKGGKDENNGEKKEIRTILTVPDSASYLALFKESYCKDIFLIFPSLIGASSIASSIFLFLEKVRFNNGVRRLSELIKDKKGLLAKNKILIIGGGRGLFYLLERLDSLLAHEIETAEDRAKFIENTLIIFNDEEVIKNNSANSGKRNVWKVALERYGQKIGLKYNIPFYLSKPFRVETISGILNRRDKIALIVIFNEKPLESLKILMSVKIALAAKKEVSRNQMPSILISTSSFERALTKEQLISFDYMYKSEDKSFPTQRDLQLVHDYVVADEVASIFRAWTEESNRKQSILSDPFLVSLCIRDYPGALAKCLLLLAGYDISKIEYHEKRMLSFHASNSLIDRKNQEAYIFEGIASLEKPITEKSFLRGIFINSSERNLYKIDKAIKELLISPLSMLGEEIKDSKDINKYDCPGYCVMCPISIVKNPYDFDFSALKSKKNIKRIYLYANRNKITPLPKSYAKIWIYGNNASFPGALGIGLKDLLLIGGNRISWPGETKRNHKKEVIDIKYLSNIECAQNEATLRNFYGVIKAVDISDQQNELRKGTLEAICIKAAEKELWKYYASSLQLFLNNEYNPNKHYFFDNDLNDKFPCYFVILEKGLDADKVKHIFKRMEIFWHEDDIQAHIDDLIYKHCVY